MYVAVRLWHLQHGTRHEFSAVLFLTCSLNPGTGSGACLHRLYNKTVVVALHGLSST